MAQLHGRVRGVPDSALAVLCACVALGSSVAAAQAPSLSTSVEELEAWAADLGAESPEARERAVARLSTLESDALPAIEARIGAARRLDSDATYDALRSFRHVLGSRRADDMIDIAPGVPQVLADHRDRVTVAVAERVLLARSLEGIGGRAGMKALGDLFATDANAWRWEMRRTIDRMGARALPGLLALRSHSDRAVRSWARSSIEALGLGEPGRAVQELGDDNGTLAELLRAYGETRDMDAMPVVVSFTTHERAQVRAAARWATEEYGQNAIWQLRRVYRNLTESDADRGWSWRRTMDELFRVADGRRLEPVREDLAAGKAALAAGELDAMRERFDAVLRRAPGLEGRAELGPGYAMLAARELAGDRLDEAAALYRRAVRLAPDHPDANRWRAEVAYVEAELSLARGTVDLGSYETAVALAPGHAAATRALDLLTGEADERSSDRRRVAAAGAALLLLLAAFLWLRRRRTRTQSPPRTPTIDAAPDTLPG